MTEPSDVRYSAASPGSPGNRLLVVGCDERESLGLLSDLEGVGFHTEMVQASGGVVVEASRSQPDAIVFAPDVRGGVGLAHLEQLKGDRRTLLIPVLFVIDDPQLVTVLALLAAGADDCVASPCDVNELAARLRVATSRRVLLGGVSPLTGLPGNVWLTRSIQQRLDDAVPFAFLQVDIDNFKAFNDRYGFVRGDRVIAATATLLDAVAVQLGPDDTVVGHIGGDDFAVVTSVERGPDIAHDVIDRFDRLVPDFYDTDDRVRGWTVADGRGRGPREFPLMSVSIGLTLWTPDRPRSTAAVADAASILKGRAKGRRGSYVASDGTGAGVSP